MCVYIYIYIYITIIIKIKLSSSVRCVNILMPKGVHSFKSFKIPK